MAWTKITRAQHDRKACRYSTDLSDEDFAVMEPYFPAVKPLGRPRRTELREVVNAILYVLRTGCPWNENGGTCWRRISHQQARFTVISDAGRWPASGRQCIMAW